MKFAEALQRDRRLVILRLLNDTGGSLNESVIRDGLRDLGHVSGLTDELVRDELRYLEGVGCIVIKWFGDRIMVAVLTKRGVDCVAGSIEVEGVKKPSLGV